MTNPCRAMCAELFEAIQLYTGQNPAAANVPPSELVCRLMNAMAASAALLAQPEPEGLTDEALLRLAREWNSGYESIEFEFIVDYARAAIAADRARHPTPHTPADGEVAELVEWLQEHEAVTYAIDDIAESRRYARAADLLQRLASPCYVLDADAGAITVLEGRPVLVGDRLPELRGVFERIVFTSSNVSHIRLADRLIDAVLTWLPANALPTPEVTDD